MKTDSFRRSFVSLPFVLLLILVAACAPAPGPSPTPISIMAPAETPILESILDMDHKLIVPYHAIGVFTMQPGRQIELRLRAPWPTSLWVEIEGQPLVEVPDLQVNHPHDGFYHISEIRPIDDIRMFWRVLVVLPQDKQGNVDFALTVHDSSGQQEADPLQIVVYRTPVIEPRPSSVFFDAPDAKHNKTGSDSAFIADNITLAGWLMGDTELERNGEEDWHYGIWLDNDFIERNYTPITEPVAHAIMPGRWYTELDNLIHPKKPIPLTDGKQPSASTFMLMGNAYFEVELNAWHVSKHNGTHPAGWVQDPEPGWPDVYWPFPPMKPFGIGPNDPPLQQGDYVIITGALVEDSLHHPPDPGRWCWHEHYSGHGGWLEIHPVDSIRRVDGPKMRIPATDTKPPQTPYQYKYPFMENLCDSGDGTTLTFENVNVRPDPPDPPSPNAVIKYTEIIDERFTDMSTVQDHSVRTNPCDPTALQVITRLRPGAQGHFKAVYMVWWEIADHPRPAPLPSCNTTPNPSLELRPCVKKPSLPQCDNPTIDEYEEPGTPETEPTLIPHPSTEVPGPTVTPDLSTPELEPTSTRDPACRNKPYLPQCQ